MRDRNTRRKLTTALGLCGACAVGVWLGRGGPQPALTAAPPPAAAPAGDPRGAGTPATDYGQRVVAYIHGSEPVTREDLGEYLIARQGADKVELLVNKRIIERACQQAGLDVTAAEVEAALDQDCEAIKVKRGEFVGRVLKQYGKTLYEWKEDVIRPRLQLQKLCQGRIKVTDEDLQKAYQSQYGPKVDCRLVIWPKGEERAAMNEFSQIRQSEEAFNRKACTQAVSSLAAVGGRIQPVGRHSGTHPDVEQQAFGLQPGEVSKLIATPEGTVCLKVDRLLPADESVKFADVKEQLTKVVYDKKVAEQIPGLMKELHEQAKPVFILKRVTTAEELEREVKTELQQTGGSAPKKP